VPVPNWGRSPTQAVLGLRRSGLGPGLDADAVAFADGGNRYSGHLCAIVLGPEMDMLGDKRRPTSEPMETREKKEHE